MLGRSWFISTSWMEKMYGYTCPQHFYGKKTCKKIMVNPPTIQLNFFMGKSSSLFFRLLMNDFHHPIIPSSQLLGLLGLLGLPGLPGSTEESTEVGWGHDLLLIQLADPYGSSRESFQPEVRLRFLWHILMAYMVKDRDLLEL